MGIACAVYMQHVMLCPYSGGDDRSIKHAYFDKEAAQCALGTRLFDNENETDFVLQSACAAGTNRWNFKKMIEPIIQPT